MSAWHRSLRSRPRPARPRLGSGWTNPGASGPEIGARQGVLIEGDPDLDRDLTRSRLGDVANDALGLNGIEAICLPLEILPHGFGCRGPTDLAQRFQGQSGIDPLELEGPVQVRHRLLSEFDERPGPLTSQSAIIARGEVPDDEDVSHRAVERHIHWVDGGLSLAHGVPCLVVLATLFKAFSGALQLVRSRLVADLPQAGRGVGQLAPPILIFGNALIGYADQQRHDLFGSVRRQLGNRFQSRR